MKRILFLALLAFIGTTALAQSVFCTTPTAESQKMLDSVKYVMPEFVTGTIFFDNGTQYIGPVNIFTLNQKIHFKNEDGEVMSLDNNSDVSSVYIKGRTFLNSRYGYVEVYEAHDEMFMGEIRILSVFSEAKEGAFGTKSQTTSIQTVDLMEMSHSTMLDLTENKRTPYSYKKIPYVYRKGNFQKASKKFFIKNFSDKKGFIEDYLQNNDVDFENVQDVRKLFRAVIK